MKKYIFLILLPLIGFCQEKKSDTIRVYYLGGQSNMMGYGNNKDLPKDLNTTFKEVHIFHGNPVGDNEKNGGIGIWTQLKSGNGDGFTSDGKVNKYSDKFGIELSFAKKMKELYPNQRIAIIKYARIGSSIDSIGTQNFGSWDADYKAKTGINQYDYFLKTFENAFADKDIDNDGREDILIPAGILWMQGESDADKTEIIAQNYYQNLKKLLFLMRAAFRNNDLPIVIGKISDSGQDADGKVWDYCELVQYGQEKLAKTVPNVQIIRQTLEYKYSDKYHYNSEGYVRFGYEFANKFALFRHKFQ